MHDTRNGSTGSASSDGAFSLAHKTCVRVCIASGVKGVHQQGLWGPEGRWPQLPDSDTQLPMSCRPSLHRISPSSCQPDRGTWEAK